MQIPGDPGRTDRRPRRRLATAKTHTTIQRGELARAIIVPKVLYVARHVWSSRASTAALQAFTKRFVWGGTSSGGGRAWISEEQAELAPADGGVGVPNLTSELLLLGVMTVARWATSAASFDRFIGDALSADAGAITSNITPGGKVDAARSNTLEDWSVATCGGARGARPHSLVHQTRLQSVRRCGQHSTQPSGRARNS